MMMAFLGICSLVLAGVVFLAAVADAGRLAQVRRRGLTAEAEVTGVNTCYHRASVSHRLVIRFTTAHGQVVTTQLRWGRAAGRSAGDPVTIRYLPGQPEIAGALDADPAAFSVIGNLLTIAVFVFLGVVLLSWPRH
jgi:hypothetical protein